MIPLCLVTGFLGSGKTALLRHIAHQHNGQRLVFLVNEFAAVDVDGPVLEHDAPGQVLGLPGGSIFCTCLVTEFIRVLQELPERFGPDIDGVIIEASGVANPKVVARMLAETKLDAVYQIASVIAVADPGTFAILLQTLPNLRAQIEASDHVLINKSDLFDKETLCATERAVREINPAATITQTQYGKVNLEPIPKSTCLGKMPGTCNDHLHHRHSRDGGNPGKIDTPEIRCTTQERPPVPVIPAKAGIQVLQGLAHTRGPLDPRFRGDDGKGSRWKEARDDAQLSGPVLDLFGVHTPRPIEGEYASCKDPNYAKASVRFTHPVNLARFLAALENFGPGLYRAKASCPRRKQCSMWMCHQAACRPRPCPNSPARRISRSSHPRTPPNRRRHW